MKKKVLSICILSTFMLLNVNMINEAFSQSSTTNQSSLQGSVMVIPSGTTIAAMTQSELSSAYLTLGQSINLTLNQDFYYGGKLVAPSGSVVSGNVIQVKKATHGGINGNLKIRFTHITTTGGQIIPISGMIKTEDNTGLLVGSTAKDTAVAYAKDVAVGAGVGALAGVIISPMAGGKIGKGTALATAVGAGGGLAKSVWDKGVDAVIPCGSQISIILNQPITYTPSNRY